MAATPPATPPGSPSSKNPGSKNPASKGSRAAARKAELAAAKIEAKKRYEERMRKERRRRLLLIVGVPVVVVLLVVAIFVVIKANSTDDATSTIVDDPAAVQPILTLPETLFDTVGAGDGIAAPTSISGDALTADGKARVLYIGAEYCPFCAAQRWGLAIALSRFGTFTGLGASHSSTSDVYPGTATLTFLGSTYTSDVVSFTGVETQGNVAGGDGRYPTLETPEAADQTIFDTYNTAGSIPFVDVGNRYAQIGAPFQPTAMAGLTHAQVVTAIQDPTTTISKEIIGSANAWTAAICVQTNQLPAAVCTSAGVTAAAATLPA